MAVPREHIRLLVTINIVATIVVILLITIVFLHEEPMKGIIVAGKVGIYLGVATGIILTIILLVRYLFKKNNEKYGLK
jgi:preprotein translocase subunit SecF